MLLKYSWVSKESFEKLLDEELEIMLDFYKKEAQSMFSMMKRALSRAKSLPTALLFSMFILTEKQ